MRFSWEHRYRQNHYEISKSDSSTFNRRPIRQEDAVSWLCALAVEGDKIAELSFQLVPEVLRFQPRPLVRRLVQQHFLWFQ